MYMDRNKLNFCFCTEPLFQWVSKEQKEVPYLNNTDYFS